jgi:hypothetical protein
MIRLAAATLLALALSSAAQASSVQCLTSKPGVSVSFGVTIGVGGEFSESDQNEFNLMRLRQMGVDASRAEMWGGCIRAFVPKPGGGEEMQFFHPDTFERVYM